jgi:hypothetical protein
MDIFGAQFEEGSNASPYIETTSAFVTRDKTIFTMNNVTKWFRNTEGTFKLEFILPSSIKFNSNKFAFSIYGDNSNNTAIAYFGVSNNGQFIYQTYNTSNVICKTIITDSDFSPKRKSVLAYNSQSQIYGETNTPVKTVTPSAVLNNVGKSFRLGSDSSGNLSFDGYIRSFIYYPYKATENNVHFLIEEK